ncbi:protein kinase STUNTED-like [Alnus glutinosa]|uniref:protein kinase STUNTED-like n=1 Tax=Alnus glutinosa TaxID=3517 RepID=UPI002D774A4E|nr:protein kinase STUNTED-like [Alnus glutinosa]
MSHLKKYKDHIKGKIWCNLVVVKGKDAAAVLTSKAPQFENSDGASSTINGDGNVLPEEGSSSAPLPPPESPCWYPLSWRSGFPRAFDQSELETITNGFADENIVMEADGMKIYQGILQDLFVLVKCFSESDHDRFWSLLKILSSIGGSLRYLHEECADGPIVHLSVSSAHVYFSHGYSTMLGNLATAKWLTDAVSWKEDSPADQCKALEKDEGPSVDVYDYGSFLLELITGKSAPCFQAHGNGQSLVDWAIPLLDNGSFTQLMDPRITDTSDTKVVHHMANAAFCCLKKNKGHRLSMSEVLAVVRGDELAISKYGIFGTQSVDM